MVRKPTLNFKLSQKPPRNPSLQDENLAPSTGFEDDSANIGTMLAESPNVGSTIALSGAQSQGGPSSPNHSSHSPRENIEDRPMTPTFRYELLPVPDAISNKKAELLFRARIALIGSLKAVIDSSTHFVRKAVDVIDAIELYSGHVSEVEEVAKLLHDLLRDGLELIHVPKPPIIMKNIEQLMQQRDGESIMELRRSRPRFGLSRHHKERLVMCRQNIPIFRERLRTIINRGTEIQRDIDLRLEKLPYSPEARYNSAESESLPRVSCWKNTRLDVLRQLYEWATDDHSQKLYWLSGMAGTGKTTIAYSFCKQLEENHLLAASFFCTRRLPSCCVVNKILASISFQIASYSMPFRYALSDIVEHDPEVYNRPLIDQFDTLISSPLQRTIQMIPNGATVVIDGLDECSDPAGINQLLSTLLERLSNLPLKVLITSRPEATILSRMGIDRQRHILQDLRLHELDNLLVQRDIKEYLSDKLEQLQLTAQNLDALVEQCEAYFTYAEALVRFAEGRNVAIEIQQLVQVLKTPYNEVVQRMYPLYQDFLTRIIDSDSIIAEKKEIIAAVLRTIASTGNPMTAAELATFLGLDSPDVVLEALQSLLAVAYVHDSQPITLIHPSFAHYAATHAGLEELGRNIRRRAAHLAPRTISRSMDVMEIISHLMDHGCPNLTDQFDPKSCNEYAFSAGGLGDVYKGSLKTGRQVAVKTLRVYQDALSSGNRTYLRHAAHELYTWFKCQHRNIHQLAGLVEFRGQIGMISGWEENGSLRYYLQKYPSANRCLMSMQISDGLSYLHESNVVHGDLKGDNILIDEAGVPLISDFGNAILQEHTLKFTGTTTNIRLSYRWAAPELLEGITSYSVSADVYALAMTILETFTGEIPYPEKNDRAVAIAVTVKNEIPIRPSGHIPTGTEQGDLLWSLLQGCWVRDPKLRPSALQVKHMMEKITPEGLAS
ncbi:Vegetative incompatibility protein HET-E-1 [Ceratobasidium sp. AG-Ba]|nr:Vegetative incompatibility protein HET-E-1 [Ceratobasidium sp. AG-Ba]